MKRIAIGLALLCVACGSEDAPSFSYTSVLQTLNFEREEPKGVTKGMNLDGWVSGSNDDRACRKPDFVDPDGNEGIDNELARLLPVVDLAGEGAFQALVQNAITEGALLMILDATIEEDGTATVDIRRGDDLPLLGTDGRILPGQTLALHEDEILGATSGARSGTTLETSPTDIRIPIVVFSQLYVVTLKDAILRLEIGEEDYIQSGMIAGGLPIEELIQVLRTASNFAGDFEALLGDAVRDSGDLARDDSGNCTWMSASVTFDAVPAFTF